MRTHWILDLVKLLAIGGLLETATCNVGAISADMIGGEVTCQTGATCSVCTAECGVVANGPFAHWKLDEGTGITAVDSSGNGNAAALATSPNTPSWEAGKTCEAGACLTFDGNNQYASAALDLSDTGVITVAFWLAWSAYADDDRLAMELGAGARGYNSLTTGFLIDPNSTLSSGGQFEASLKGDAGYNQVLFARPSTGVWHHYAFVLDKGAMADTEVTPYVDGFATAYSKPAGNADNTNTFGRDMLYLMTRNGSSLFGTGGLDDVRLYKRALTAGEIQALAGVPPDATLPTTPTGLSAIASSCDKIVLHWGAVTDSGGSGLRNYNLYRNGSFLVQVPGDSTFDTGLTASTSYSYAVSAVDNAGNESAKSAAAIALTPACPHGTHRRCGWLGPGDTAGYTAFAANAGWYDVIHPDWYAINSDGVTVRAIEGEGSTVVRNAATANHVALWPLVAGVENDAWQRNMMASSSLRAEHIQILVNLAVSHDYAGLDIDYEHMWNAGDQALYSQFMKELAAAMHAAGKLLSDAAGGMSYPSSNGAWNYLLLSTTIDAIHIMGYDYHWIGGSHAGPTAPLGWIQAVATFAATTGHAEKFILGLPNYGIAESWFCALADCAAACTGPISTSTDEMLSCPNNVDDHFAAGRVLNCQSSHGMLFFDDTASLEEKVQAAKSNGLGGVTYWTVGSEPAGFFSMVQKYY